MKKVIIVIVGLFIFGTVIGLVKGGDNSASTTSEENILIDVNQFSRIDSEQLKTLMGEPDSIENWNNKTNHGTYAVTTYYYGQGKYEFLVIENLVARMNIRSDKYNNKDAESIKYTSEQSILEMLNIDSSDERIRNTADTGFALRFSPVSDNVADVWCSLMNKKDKTIDEIKVTFNMNYFE